MGFFKAVVLSVLLGVGMVLGLAYFLGDLDIILGAENKPGLTHDRNY